MSLTDMEITPPAASQNKCNQFVSKNPWPLIKDRGYLVCLLLLHNNIMPIDIELPCIRRQVRSGNEDLRGDRSETALCAGSDNVPRPVNGIKWTANN